MRRGSTSGEEEASTTAEAGHPEEPPTAGGGNRGSRAAFVCQLESCGKALSREKEWYRRCRVCKLHAKQLWVEVRGVAHRFCQQCGVFHALSNFDGDRRNCRVRLALHNEKRRKRPGDDSGPHVGSQSDEGSEAAEASTPERAQSDEVPEQPTGRRVRTASLKAVLRPNGGANKSPRPSRTADLARRSPKTPAAGKPVRAEPAPQLLSMLEQHLSSSLPLGALPLDSRAQAQDQGLYQPRPPQRPFFSKELQQHEQPWQPPVCYGFPQVSIAGTQLASVYELPPAPALGRMGDGWVLQGQPAFDLGSTLQEQVMHDAPSTQQLPAPGQQPWMPPPRDSSATSELTALLQLGAGGRLATSGSVGTADRPPSSLPCAQAQRPGSSIPLRMTSSMASTDAALLDVFQAEDVLPLGASPHLGAQPGDAELLALLESPLLLDGEDAGAADGSSPRPAASARLDIPAERRLRRAGSSAQAALMTWGQRPSEAAGTLTPQLMRPHSLPVQRVTSAAIVDPYLVATLGAGGGTARPRPARGAPQRMQTTPAGVYRSGVAHIGVPGVARFTLPLPQPQASPYSLRGYDSAALGMPPDQLAQPPPPGYLAQQHYSELSSAAASPTSLEASLLQWRAAQPGGTGGALDAQTGHHPMSADRGPPTYTGGSTAPMYWPPNPSAWQ